MGKAAFFDTVERVFWTFTQAFLGAMLASPFFDALGLGWQDSLKIALFAGLASVAKNLLAIAITRNSTPQLGVDTYDNNPDAQVAGP